MPNQQIKSIQPISGWLLITREEDCDEQKTGDWYIAWEDLFRTKRSALAFAKENKWSRPYRAVRGKTCATEFTDA